MDTAIEQTTTSAEPPRAPSSPAALRLRDDFGPLLRIDRRDVAGLKWIKTRCQMWRNALRRRRKYRLPRGEPFTLEESELIGTLTNLENTISSLLLVQPSSLCPVSETRPEHTRQGDAENSRTQSSHKNDPARN